MFNYNVKVENYRFALQRCDECGAIFPVLYQFKEQRMVPFGFNCEHMPHASFTPLDGVTFEKWYTEQLQARQPLLNHA